MGPKPLSQGRDKCRNRRWLYWNHVITATEQQPADVIAIDPSAGNSPITDITDPTNPRRCHQNYVDNEITTMLRMGPKPLSQGQG
ncbi:MAG: hypothetical protein ACE37L_14610 [Allomuricauda sp.]